MDILPVDENGEDILTRTTKEYLATLGPIASPIEIVMRDDWTIKPVFIYKEE